jgi:hypothetical protein
LHSLGRVWCCGVRGIGGGDVEAAIQRAVMQRAVMQWRAAAWRVIFLS